MTDQANGILRLVGCIALESGSLHNEAFIIITKSM